MNTYNNIFKFLSIRSTYLGLWICQRSKGHIWVHSNCGSCKI